MCTTFCPPLSTPTQYVVLLIRCGTLLTPQIEIKLSENSPASSIDNLIDSQVASSLSQASQDQRHNFPIPTRFKTATPLQIAAFQGHLGIARLLLGEGASANTTDNDLSTSLHFAAESGQPAMIELLLEHGANVHAVDRWLTTPSMLAAKIGSLASLQILKARGADFQMRNVYGETVLHHAALFGTLFVVPVLTLAGGDGLGSQDWMGYTPLRYILKGGNWHAVLSIINFAPKLGDYDPNIFNALSDGVRNVQMTTSLLKKFMRRLSPSIVTPLLKHRAKVLGTPLYAASTAASPPNQEYFISLLLEAGADLEQVGGEHGTPLMGACAAGRLTAVKLLVGKGAKLCYEGEDGSVSALHAAKHFPEILRWLLVGRFTHGPRRILSTVDT